MRGAAASRSAGQLWALLAQAIALIQILVFVANAIEHYTYQPQLRSSTDGLASFRVASGTINVAVALSLVVLVATIQRQRMSWRIYALIVEATVLFSYMVGQPVLPRVVGLLLAAVCLLLILLPTIRGLRQGG